MSAMGLLLALVQEKLPEVAWAGEAHRRKCNYYVSTYISTELCRNKWRDCFVIGIGMYEISP